MHDYTAKRGRELTCREQPNERESYCSAGSAPKPICHAAAQVLVLLHPKTCCTGTASANGERLKHNHGQVPSPNPNSSSYCQNKEVQKQIKNRSQPIKTMKNQLVPFQTHLLVKQETSPPAQRGQNPFLNDHFGLSSPATNTRGLSRALFQYASPSASQLPIN